MRALSLILILLTLLGKAQDSKNEYWSTASFSKKIYKKTHLNLDLGFRFEDITENNSSLLELGLTRKLPQKFKIGFEYRYADKSSIERKFRKVHRTSLSLSKSIKIKKFKFSYRSKFQYELKNQVSRKNNDLTDCAWRNKIKVSKKVYKRTFVNLGSELFSFEDYELLSRYRFSGGVKYGITKRIELNLQAIYEAEFYDVDQSKILSIGYAQRF